MDLEKLPWDKGIAAILAVVLIKIMWDCVYRKIPIGFRRLRRSVDLQTRIMQERTDELIVRITAVEASISILHKDLDAQAVELKRKTAAPRGKPKKP